MSAPAVRLRPTRGDELALVRALESGADTRCWLGDVRPGWHAAALADPGCEHLLATVDGPSPDVVGFVVLAGPRGTETGVELRRIVVAAGHRGRGLGRSLLRAAVERAGSGRVWLDVRPGNERALALYRAEGFTDERALPRDPRDPDGPTALLVLSRSPSRSR